MSDIISVIVPIYNVEKYLEKCVESIKIQSFKNLEIILVDDGATDSSGVIADELALTDNRIIVVHKKNGGLSDARNAGIERATGRYLAFVDSDDMIHKEMFLTLYDLMVEHHADITECYNFMFFSEDELKDIKLNNEVIINDKVSASMNLKTVVLDNQVMVWNKLYKRELFNNLSFSVGKLHEDQFITYKLFYEAEKIVTTRSSLYFYRKTDQSIMRRAYNLSRLDVVKAYIECLEFYESKHEEQLYNITLIGLLNTIIKHYYLIKQNKGLSKYKGELYSCFKKYYKSLDSSIKVNPKNKFSFFIFSISPIIYDILRTK